MGKREETAARDRYLYLSFSSSENVDSLQRNAGELLRSEVCLKMSENCFRFACHTRYESKCTGQRSGASASGLNRLTVGGPSPAICFGQPSGAKGFPPPMSLVGVKVYWPAVWGQRQWTRR